MIRFNLLKPYYPVARLVCSEQCQESTKAVQSFAEITRDDIDRVYGMLDVLDRFKADNGPGYARMMRDYYQSSE